MGLHLLKESQTLIIFNLNRLHPSTWIGLEILCICTLCYSVCKHTLAYTMCVCMSVSNAKGWISFPKDDSLFLNYLTETEIKFYPLLADIWTCLGLPVYLRCWGLSRCCHFGNSSPRCSELWDGFFLVRAPSPCSLHPSSYGPFQ